MTLSVVQFVTSTGYAGIERHVAALADRLQRAGVDVAVVAPLQARRLRAELEHAEIEVFAGPENDVRGLRRVLQLRSAFAGRDILHVHDGGAAIAATVMSSPSRATVRTQHFVATASSHRRPLARKTSSSAHALANRGLSGYIAVSRAAADAADARGELVASSNVRIIPPGVEILDQRTYERASDRRASSGYVRVMFAGRLEFEKRIDTLITALPQVLSTYGDMRLRIVGDGTDSERLHLLAHRLGVANAVEWQGWRDLPLEEMQDADIYVNPWPDEGYGMAMAEAMGSGLPVIAPAAGASPELVADGTTGLLVKPLDSGDLARALNDLVGDERRRRAMGAAARQVVLGSHSYDAAAAATLRFYTEIDTQRRAASSA